MTALIPIDRPQMIGRLRSDGCCPPDLCQIDPCALICSFVELLPRGPLWDRAKAEALARYATPAAGCGTVDCGPHCTSVVDYAVLAGRMLYHHLMDALWPAIRESNPYTAHDTLDQWLERLGWRDCFDCACRDPEMEGVSPVEVLGFIDGCETALCCPPEFPPELVCAVKKGIVASLARLRFGVVRNLYGINAIIAPLGAKLEPKCWRWIELDPRHCQHDDGYTAPVTCGRPTEAPACDVEAPPDPYECEVDQTCAGQLTTGADCRLRMRQYEFRLVPTSDRLAACVRANCFEPRDGAAPTVVAYYHPTCRDPAGLPERIWPGVMAAECVVRGLLPPGARIKLTRGC